MTQRFRKIVREELQHDHPHFDDWLPDMGAALAYMIRRYGYTTEGSDDHKALCRYVIPTSIENFFVSVTMRGSHTLIGWAAPQPLWGQIHGYEPVRLWRTDMKKWAEGQGDPIWNRFSGEHYHAYLRKHTDKQFTDEWFASELEAERIPFEDLYKAFTCHVDESYERMSEAYRKIVPFPNDDSAQLPADHPLRPFEDAFRATLTDLLNPVYIRDVPRNILGRMTDEEVMHSEEIYGRESTAVDFHTSAGYGVPRAFVEDPSRFYDVVNAIVKMGGGDFWGGVASLKVLLPENTIANLQSQLAQCDEHATELQSQLDEAIGGGLL